MSEFKIKDLKGEKVEFSSNKDWSKEFKKKSYEDLEKEENNMKNEVLYIDTKKLSKNEIKQIINK